MNNKTESKKLPSPSEYMRQKRPELFSDTKDKSSYRLSESELSFGLSTLTEQNRHKAFEEFCKAVAEREICSNLRPQTGPEGGGDGKVDTETYPVSSDISERHFVATSGDERWAFTMSAKKQWKAKVKKDIQGVIDTKRPYAKVHSFTNQNPRAKIRLDLEDELTTSHEIDVTIYDRNWLVEKTIKNDHRDLAFRFLGLGEEKRDKPQIGQHDTRRKQELEDLEKALTGRGGTTILSGYDAVEASRWAAQLSRQLECPRIETDGRHLRAIKLASDYGEQFEILRALYDKIWTGVFWFNDYGPLLEHYNEAEKIALASNSCLFLEKLSTLLSLICNLELLSDSDTWGAPLFSKRYNNIATKLKELAVDLSRPNHALYAETILAHTKMSEICCTRDLKRMDNLFVELRSILKRSDGLGEYPIKFLETFAEIGFTFKGNQSPAFYKFVESLSERTGQRDGEITKGEFLIKMAASALDKKTPLPAITYFGRAATAFAKEETQLEYAQALSGLEYSYAEAGLHWAARAARLSMMVAIQNAVLSEDLPKKMGITAALDYAMGAILLSNIPEVLFGILLVARLVNGSDISKSDAGMIQAKIVEVDSFLACGLGTWENKDIEVLSTLPDILVALGLPWSSATLLYRLGYQDELTDLGVLTDDFTLTRFEKMVKAMPAQPLIKQIKPHPVSYLGSTVSLRTQVLGVNVTVECQTSREEVALAEALITSLEAFSATFPDVKRIMGLTNQAFITIQIADEYSVIPDLSQHSLLVKWPRSKPVFEATREDDTQIMLIQAVATFVPIIFYVENLDELLARLVGEERMMERAFNYGNPSFVRGRIFGAPVGFATDIPSIIDLQEIVDYPIKKVTQNQSAVKNKQGRYKHSDIPLSVHEGTRNQSLINTHLWNSAGWTGFGFITAQNPNDRILPAIAFHFKNPVAGRKIFELWRKEIGQVDTHERIRVSLITGIDANNPAHYKAGISENFPKVERQDGAIQMMMSRTLIMEPPNSINLNRFLAAWPKDTPYLLVPMIGTTANPQPDTSLGIQKKRLSIKEAWAIGASDEDAMIMSNVTNPIIPTGEDNAPFFTLSKMYADIKAGKPYPLKHNE